MYPLRKSTTRIDYEALRREYLSNEYTIAELAERAGTSNGVIRTTLHSMGLTRHYKKVSAFLTQEQWKVLETEALVRGQKPCTLAAMMLSTIIRDDLFDAVLDEPHDRTQYAMRKSPT